MVAHLVGVLPYADHPPALQWRPHRVVVRHKLFPIFSEMSEDVSSISPPLRSRKKYFSNFSYL